MITQEQYDKINEGDMLVARFKASALVGEFVGEFEVKGAVYVSPYSAVKSIAGWQLCPGGHDWTIIEHDSAAPDWHDAIMITATSPDHKGYREVFRNVNGSTRPWRASISGHYYLHDELSDVKVLVGKDDSL